MSSPATRSCRTCTSDSLLRSTTSGATRASREAAQQAAQPTGKRPIPLVAVLRRPKNLLLAGLGTTAAFVIQALFSTFGVTYATEHGSPGWRG
jgi:hypothetical protein